MKSIKTKMIIAILSVFIVSFTVIIVNIGSNQGVINKSQSLLKDNYPSVKYSFAMLNILDELNLSLIIRKITTTDSLMHNDNLIKDSLLLFNFRQNIQLQQNNITEAGEKELTELLNNAFTNYEKGVYEEQYIKNQPAFNEKYTNLRSYILSIHNLNVELLESKNETIKGSAQRILKIQENVGIATLAILSVLLITLPMLLINPIDNLTARMIKFYKINFNKEIEIKTNHELEKLEAIFEKIVLETKSKESKTE